MKIVYLTHQYLPRHIGGVEVYAHGLATRAQRAGHSVRVITHAESSSRDAKDYLTINYVHDGISVSELRSNLSRADNPARAEYDHPQIVELLKHQLDSFRPDVVHALHAMKLSGAALELCYDRGLPVVLTLADYWFICPRHTLVRWNRQLCDGPAHDLDCMRCLRGLHGFANSRLEALPAPLLRAASASLPSLFDGHLPRFWRDVKAIRDRPEFLRALVERADWVLALSAFQKEMFVRNGYSAEKIQVLHHGIETEGLKPAKPSANGDVKIVYIGSLVYHKGPHVLAEALARRPESKVRLLLYGDASHSTPYLESLKELVAADERVRLMGTFPLNEMGRVLETAHALAMPALWYENEPLVVKAAQYVGLPVLASDLGTLAASVQDGVTGWLLPPGDIEAWANAIASLTPTAVEPNASIKSMDENARELLEIYEDVYSKRCSAPNT